MKRGVAVVSIDTELAWGDSHRRDGAPRREYDTEREIVARVLDLFARYDISATWAIVGHLFLDQCEAVDGRAHPEIVRPAYPWLHEDWFAIDPCTRLHDAPDYYGRDIVDAITRCPTPQEIGCHSFSHLIASGCPENAFVSDLDACRAAAGTVPLRSFVYPRNEVDHVVLLPRHGFTCYRGSTRSGRESGTGPVLPRRDPSGVWNIPQTYLFAPATRSRRLPVWLWVTRPNLRLWEAARRRSLFHLWFHPYNVTAAPTRALRALDRVCAQAARARDAGRIDIMTMGALAERLESDVS